MAKEAKSNWDVGYSVNYTDGRTVRDKATVGPCRFMDVSSEAKTALTHIMSLPDVKGIDICTVENTRKR